MRRKTNAVLVVTVLLSLLFSISAFSATVKYAYDDLYRLVRVEHSNGVTVVYTYDDLGNRTQMVRTVAGVTNYLYVSIDGGCGEKTPCYASIQNAIHDAATGAVIRIRGETYAESITLNAAKSLILQGGWNSSFSSQTENTILKGAPKAPKGSLTMKELSIKP